jgi:tetratricopeptide (TPR) repeat protein
MKRRRIAGIVLAVYLGLTFGVLASPPNPKIITTSNPFLNLTRPADDPRWAPAFSAWDLRDDDAQVTKAVALFAAIAKAQPDKLAPQLWLARSTYLLGMRRGGADRSARMTHAAAAADRALKLEPGNETARYWRWAAMMFFEDYTAQDFAEIREFGKRYEKTRELPVPADDPRWAEAISRWDRRLSRDESMKAVALFEQLEKKYPKRLEPKLWLMRSHYWLHYIEPTDEAKARRLMIAVEWGRKAIAMEPRNPPANYFTAAALGQYGLCTNFMNIVRYAYEITGKLIVVMEEDPQYFYGGVSQYFSLAIAKAGTVVTKMLGMFGYSELLVSKGAQFAVNYEPRYLRNYYSLGEMYLSQGKPDEAKKMWMTVLHSDPAALKNMEPENRVAQETVRKLMSERFPK